MPPFRGRFNRDQSRDQSKQQSQNQTPAPQQAPHQTGPSNPAPRVSTKTEDFLKNDANIPGQNYVCMSFISPEEVIMNKQAFFVHTYMKNLLSRFNFSEEPTLDELKYFKDEMSKFLTPEGAEDKFKEFVVTHQDQIEKQYYEQNNFQTTIRGVKVRGVYDTYREAQLRAEELRINDRNFNVYIGQVGYWLPWDPNPLSIKDQEFQESELNTLVKKYNENIKLKDQHFQENIEYVREQAAKLAEQKKAEQSSSSSLEVLNESESESTSNYAEQKKAEQSSSSSLEVLNESESESTSNYVSDELSEELAQNDPWLARKVAEAKSVADLDSQSQKQNSQDSGSSEESISVESVVSSDASVSSEVSSEEKKSDDSN
jgi:hypothetical protein